MNASGANAIWYLEGLMDTGDTNKHVTIGAFPFRIGRRPGLDLFLPDVTISKEHAELFEDCDRLYIRDLNSTNGTTVNGVRVKQTAPLNSGDLIYFGDLLFRLGCFSQSGHTTIVLGAPSQLALQAEIAERRRVEDALRDSQARYQAIVNSAADGIITVDDHGLIGSVNSAIENIFGYTQVELIGQRVSILMPKAERRQSEVRLRRQLAEAGGAPFGPHEFLGAHKSGAMVSVEVTASRLNLVKGRAFVGIVRDISARKAIEVSLRESEERHRLTIETALDAVVSADSRGIITGWNAQAELIFGWPRDEAIGRNLSATIIPEPNRNAFEQGLRQFLTSGDGNVVNQRVEQMAVHRNGNEFPVEIAISAGRFSGEVSFSAFIRDISQRKQTEEDLHQAIEAAEEANRCKSTFLANMSHEIRTPMTVILGYADVLRRSAHIPENAEPIEMITRNGQHLLQLINDILDLSKLSAGKVQVESIPCSPRRLVSEVHSYLNARALDKGIALTATCGDSVPDLIQSDPTRLRQILLNLASNAVKFTDRGEVSIATRCVTDAAGAAMVEVSVTDTGIGMSAEQLARLFQPFAQADSSSTRRYGGTGLGLSISAGLAEKLGGRLFAESTPGAGSVFRLLVPATCVTPISVNVTSPAEGSSGTGTHSSRWSLQRRGLRVLLADDAADVRRLLSFVLQQAGAQITEAENGEQAVEQLERSSSADDSTDARSRFDLVLMDIQMPVLDGYEATRRIRALGYTGPIIALTAHAMVDVRDKCIQAGCTDYATKPVDVDALCALIDHYTQLEETAGAARTPTEVDSPSIALV